MAKFEVGKKYGLTWCYFLVTSRTDKTVSGALYEETKNGDMIVLREYKRKKIEYLNEWDTKAKCWVLSDIELIDFDRALDFCVKANKEVE